MKIIATVHNDYTSKFGVPRQSGLVNAVESLIVFEPEYRNPDALRGIEDFSHLWLIWSFHLSARDEWSPTVRPPRLGGNTRVGVFATRSPFRPNPIGLSSVRFLGVENTKEFGWVLRVSGADLMNGTPIYDIKPYLPSADSHPEATGGFTDTNEKRTVSVHIPDEIKNRLPAHKREALIAVLHEDPRPAYQNDPDRIYGFEFAGHNIRFKVSDNILTVLSID